MKKISGPLQEGLSTHCRRRHKFAIKACLCNTGYFHIVDSNTYLSNTRNSLLHFSCSSGYVNEPVLLYTQIACLVHVIFCSVLVKTITVYLQCGKGQFQGCYFQTILTFTL